jgi:hypothetical protein
MKKVFRIGVAFIIMATLIVGYYFYLSRRSTDNSTSRESETITEYSRLKNTDLKSNYPMTPRAVVKMYNRIITEYYAKKHSDKEITVLAKQARKLMDDDLLKENPEDTYIESVKKDIKSYSDRKARIISSNVENSEYIEYKVVQDHECAYVESYYFSKEGSNFLRTYQKYCLRKDKEGNWKILTWKMVDGNPDNYE